MRHLILGSLVIMICTDPLPAAPPPSQLQLDFFESRIRPILAQECYECHSTATKQKGGLTLDSRPGWQAGGDSGDAIKPGDPQNSLLLQTLKHEHEDLKMPKNGAKLDDKTIAAFEQWIREGAPDPRDAPPSKEQVEKESSWSAILQRRKQEWWAFQNLKSEISNLKSIDDFIEAELKKQNIHAAPSADAATLARRTSFILTGLPPHQSYSSHQSQVEALLNSPQFGEKWARHFMDWVRYAESYGSEGDPAIPYAWRYRDYLIRAFNDDVPYPQLIKEAIAGDLLPKPRLKNGLNESAIGIAQLRMVLHGFSPVDSLDEMVTFTDNQIDTVTKAFQALTVSCARCHNHKFDAISQTDFYALYGIFTSTHPAVIDANAPGTGDAIRAELQKLKTEIKTTLISNWLSKLPQTNAPSKTENREQRTENFVFHGLPRSQPGEFTLHDNTLRIHPSGYISNTLTQKDRAVLFTDRFKCEGGTLWFRVAGNGGVKAKYVVQNYPRTGTIHKAIELKDAKDEKLGWRSLDLEFWKGDEIFLQLTTAADMPAEFKADSPSWFILNNAVITKDATAPADVKRTSKFVPRHLVEAWQSNTLSDADVEALDALIQSKQLSLDSITPLLHRYRDLEAKLPLPTRVPGVIEADAKDAPLFVRGDHKQPSEIVPRRFLDALDPTPFATKQSGRHELAEHMADMQNNPLTARVIVNRVWHHVFGRGIVASVDNFGKLGDLPTHPELLDFLAQRFIGSSGSIKSLLRDILSSKTFQRASGSHATDPENKLLSHWSTRRLEAEAIRDSIVTLSGKLDPTLYGESVGNGDERRSIYVIVIRNSLSPFLTTFDTPVPFATRGKRDSTNVPAQSLTLLNDPNIIRWARDWALRTASATSDAERIRQMFREAFSRDATDDEVKQSMAYLTSLQAESTQEAQKLTQQENQLARLNRQITAILEPAREKLLKGKPSAPSVLSVPSPLAEWTFDNLNDTHGKLPLKLYGNARLENGALVVDGQSMAESGSLPKTLTAKTLEAWVQLDDLKQQGGGVITVQHKDGGLFDSLVFAEKTPAHWVAGSNFFERSELFEGPAEAEATTRPVHVAVVYQADGTIRGYRDGQPYGRTYRKAPGATFEPDQSQVLLGCRHAKPSGNHGLRARIYRARLYDRALTPEEVAQTAHVESNTISESDILAALTEPQRQHLHALQSQRDAMNQALEAARTATSGDDPKVQAWTSLAQSLINLKEFIYLR